MTNSEHFTSFAMSEKLYQALQAKAKEAGKSPSAIVRSILAAHLGVELEVTKIGRPRLMDDRPLPGPQKRVNKAEAEWRVTDLKKRGFTKHSVAALTKLPYAEIERLWGAA